MQALMKIASEADVGGVRLHDPSGGDHAYHTYVNRQTAQLARQAGLRDTASFADWQADMLEQGHARASGHHDNRTNGIHYRRGSAHNKIHARMSNAAEKEMSDLRKKHNIPHSMAVSEFLLKKKSK